MVHLGIDLSSDYYKVAEGAYLECSVCGKKMGIKKSDHGEYIVHGWPICCGYTMTMITKEGQP